MRRRRPIVHLVMAALLVAGVACSEPVPPTRILFLGNSHTASNDLPGVVADLATSVGIPVEVASHAPGGWWLRDHAGSEEVRRLLSESWDVVVLQEQSMAPAVPTWARTETQPAAAVLANLAVAGGARVVLFETWGHSTGSEEIGLATFESMQAAVTAGYQELGSVIGAEVAPVGQAWAVARSRHPELALHHADGYHPAPLGTHLAATVIVSTVFGLDPTRLGASGIAEATATALHEAAAEVVVGAAPE